ncbi:MAG: pyridoxal-phosphate dependent enzyme [Ignavibacteria bacterium]|nr:pyridoxal-phosphate dependent enzyme [Ignavibacteria bacterium]
MKEINLPQRLTLANTPTPVQRYEFEGAQFFMKRDDMTGMETSGNKIRKLEFLLADAIRKRADVVITCGGEQSNHARATAAACAMLGLQCKLYLWGEKRANPVGNLFLNEMFGAEMEFVNKKDYLLIDEKIPAIIAKYKAKGLNAYYIPEGGSSPLGILGYLESFSECAYLLRKDKIKGIVTAAGSGGTAAGLLLASALFNVPVKVFAVNVLYPKEVMIDKILALAESALAILNLPVNIDTAKLEVLDGYSEEGYKAISPAKIQVIKKFARETGVLLDPVYTGKAFYAYKEQFLKGKKSSNIMFLHTGGLYGVFPKVKEYLGK